MLEQKFHFPVKDLSLNYHLGEEKCQKALKLYEIWIFKVGGVLPIYPKLPTVGLGWYGVPAILLKINSNFVT